MRFDFRGFLGGFGEVRNGRGRRWRRGKMGKGEELKRGGSEK